MSRQFGKVYRATRKADGMVVAIKILPGARPPRAPLLAGHSSSLPVDEDDQDGWKKVVYETGLLQRCKSPFITSLSGSFLKDNKDLWVRVVNLDLTSGGALSSLARDSS
jgi:serine/threonine protein kinase